MFCPACALRHALAVGNPLPTTLSAQHSLWPMGWLRRLLTRNQADSSQQIALAPAEEEGEPFPPMSRADPVPGDFIEDYEILEKIGGNMGLVFKARHRRLNKLVALKLIPISDPALLARFEREIRVMGQLEHPNLVTAADARNVGPWILVAMEWIDGMDLYQLVKLQGHLPVAACCEAAHQAALGLQYAHEHGLIHRDIKPSNLMLTRSGTIKVIDMGLALITEETTLQLTQEGHVLGTMSYCPPEQIRDSRHVDIRADIYSLGCTLFHLLTGKSPYWQRKTFAEIMQAHLNDPFPSLVEARPEAPAGLDAVLARMTGKDREARFSTPSEVVEALEPFAKGAELKKLVPAATQQGPPVRGNPGKALPTPKGHQPAGGGEQRPKARWLLIAAMLVVLLAIAGTVFFGMKPPRGDRVAGTTGGRSGSSAPVVVLMDTTAEHGIYDEVNKTATSQRIGRSNASEIFEVLRDVLPPENIHEVPVGLDWARQDYVRSFHPDLLIIHRSVFYHPIAAALNLPYPPFTNHVDRQKNHEEFQQFEQRYKVLGDNKLRDFLDSIGAAEPRTRFLVYSRGTDTNWLSLTFRQKWTKELEAQYPALAGRVETMLVEKIMVDGEEKASFRVPKTRNDLRRLVRKILGLPEARE